LFRILSGVVDARAKVAADESAAATAGAENVLVKMTARYVCVFTICECDCGG